MIRSIKSISDPQFTQVCYSDPYIWFSHLPCKLVTGFELPYSYPELLFWKRKKENRKNVRISEFHLKICCNTLHPFCSMCSYLPNSFEQIICPKKAKKGFTGWSRPGLDPINKKLQKIFRISGQIFCFQEILTDFQIVLL